MITSVLGILFILIVIIAVVNRQHDIVVKDVPRLKVTSPAFSEGEKIPKDFTGDGKDYSPELNLSQLDKEAVSLAVIMDDIDHPLVGVYNHWLIWNLPAQEIIPDNISPAKQISDLSNATQGIAYGRHQYRGPKPPFGNHRYKFHVFSLNTRLDLPASTRKKSLLDAMEGHILQYGYLIGEYDAN